jgi:hypothetical protein
VVVVLVVEKSEGGEQQVRCGEAEAGLCFIGLGRRWGGGRRRWSFTPRRFRMSERGKRTQGGTVSVGEVKAA